MCTDSNRQIFECVIDHGLEPSVYNIKLSLLPRLDSITNKGLEGRQIGYISPIITKAYLGIDHESILLEIPQLTSLPRKVQLTVLRRQVVSFGCFDKRQVKVEDIDRADGIVGEGQDRVARCVREGITEGKLAEVGVVQVRQVGQLVGF